LNFSRGRRLFVVGVLLGLLRLLRRLVSLLGLLGRLVLVAAVGADLIDHLLQLGLLVPAVRLAGLLDALVAKLDANRSGLDAKLFGDVLDAELNSRSSALVSFSAFLSAFFVCFSFAICPSWA
jgi:energy-converting hydrogenase Eha subunit G